MNIYVFLCLLALLLLAGCGLPVGMNASPTAPAERAESTMTSTLPVLPTDTLTPEPIVTSTPVPTITPAVEPPASGWVAYVGADGNLWLSNLRGDEKKQLTSDARPWQGSQEGETIIEYSNLQWSSDGRFLAYERQVNRRVETGYETRTGLWVYDLAGSPRQLLEETYFLDYSWKPGEDLIAYGKAIALDYFIGNAAAQGLWAVEVDTGDSYELVQPQKGRSLGFPQWSPDGRYLAFDEILYMEGRGYFAYFDFEMQRYVSWERTIGNYALHPDGWRLAYDTLSYTPEGSERIYLNDLLGNSETPLGSDYEPGFAFGPVFSPQGERLAYLASLGRLDDRAYTVFIIEVTGGEPVSLGVFEQAYGLAWSPDGQRLALTAGGVGQWQVIIISITDGTVQILDFGSQPAWQPRDYR